jgi:hypothetical protein
MMGKMNKIFTYYIALFKETCRRDDTLSGGRERVTNLKQSKYYSSVF